MPGPPDLPVSSSQCCDYRQCRFDSTPSYSSHATSTDSHLAVSHSLVGLPRLCRAGPYLSLRLCSYPASCSLLTPVPLQWPFCLGPLPSFSLAGSSSCCLSANDASKKQPPPLLTRLHCPCSGPRAFPVAVSWYSSHRVLSDWSSDIIIIKQHTLWGEDVCGEPFSKCIWYQNRLPAAHGWQVQASTQTLCSLTKPVTFKQLLNVAVLKFL